MMVLATRTSDVPRYAFFSTPGCGGLTVAPTPTDANLAPTNLYMRPENKQTCNQRVDVNWLQVSLLRLAYTASTTNQLCSTQSPLYGTEHGITQKACEAACAASSRCVASLWYEVDPMDGSAYLCEKHDALSVKAVRSPVTPVYAYFSTGGCGQPLPVPDPTPTPPVSNAPANLASLYYADDNKQTCSESVDLNWLDVSLRILFHSICSANHFNPPFRARGTPLQDQA